MIKKKSKSTIGKIKVLKGSKGDFFTAEIIKNPNKIILAKAQEKLIQEIHYLTKKSWGDFDYDYLKKSVLESYLLCLLRNNRGCLIGVTPIKKIKVMGRIVYPFGLSVVDPDYRGMSLLTKMSVLLIKRLFVENIMRGKLGIEIIFITPNIRTMGDISRVADFIYPNPYEFDEKTQKIQAANDETWQTIREYLSITKEKYRKIEREGCVIEGFYDERPHLIVQDGEHLDKKLRDFGKKYLYSVPGREIVVRAKIGLGALIRNV